MLERLQQLANDRVNNANETTLASRTFAPWIANFRQTDYLFHLVLLWLPTPALAIARVQQRVRLGGHDVPEETILRRYHAGIRNFFQLYQALADSWFFYDNYNTEAARLLAASVEKGGVYVADTLIWQSIEEEYRSR